MRLAAIVVLLSACGTSKQEEKRSNDKPEAPPAATAPQKPSEPPPDDKSSAPAGCEEARVHFDFNSYQLPADAKATVETFAANCVKGKSTRVTIEGNADERGTEEYNLSLGENRARTVARYLELLGADKSKVKTISYGKDSPVCTDHDESCWKQNRRVALKPAK
jgi:peptidoglycan-associated lipoprotein